MSNTEFRLPEGILPCWPTPFYSRQYRGCESLNAALRNLFLAKEKESTGHVTTNVGAWHSGCTGSLWAVPEMTIVRNWIRDAAEALTRCAFAGQESPAEPLPEFIAECWALVYRSGDYQQLHLHHDSLWSGVYYVSTCTDAESGGAIEFLDPRWAARSSGSHTHLVQPQPGLLLAFPSWLQHWVQPVKGSGERVAIAFNVGVERVKPARPLEDSCGISLAHPTFCASPSASARFYPPSRSWCWS